MVLSNIKIAPRLLAGFLIIALLSAVVGVYAAISKRRQRRRGRYVRQVLLPTRTASDLVLSLGSS